LDITVVIHKLDYYCHYYLHVFVYDCSNWIHLHLSQMVKNLSVAMVMALTSSGIQQAHCGQKNKRTRHMVSAACWWLGQEVAIFQ